MVDGLSYAGLLFLVSLGLTLICGVFGVIEMWIEDCQMVEILTPEMQRVLRYYVENAPERLPKASPWPEPDASRVKALPTHALTTHLEAYATVRRLDVEHDGVGHDRGDGVRHLLLLPAALEHGRGHGVDGGGKGEQGELDAHQPEEPVDHRDPIEGHADVAWVGVSVDDAGLAPGEPRPRCSASGDALRRHGAEVDLGARLGLQQVGRRPPARALRPALCQPVHLTECRRHAPPVGLRLGRPALQVGHHHQAVGEQPPVDRRYRHGDGQPRTVEVLEELRRFADRLLDAQKSWKRVVGRLMITERTLTQTVEAIEQGGVEEIAGLLKEPEIQARIADAVNHGVEDLLDRPMRELLGEVSPEREARRRIGLRPEKPPSGACLTMAAPVRVIRRPVRDRLDNEVMRGAWDESGTSADGDACRRIFRTDPLVKLAGQQRPARIAPRP